MKKKKIKIKFILKLDEVFLAILFIALPFFAGSTTNSGGFVSRTLILIIVNLVLAQNLFKKKQVKKLNTLDSIIIFIVAITFLHFLLAVNQLNAFIQFLNFLFAALLFIFYLDEKDRKQHNMIVLLMIPGFVIQILIGILQFITEPSMAIRGSFRDPNYYSLYLIIAAFILLGYFFKIKKINRLFYLHISLVVLLFLMIVATKSRSSTGIFLLLLLTAFLFKRPKLALAVIVLIVIIILLPNPYKTHIKEVHKNDPYAYTRLNIYRMDLELFSQHFIFGTGLGCFAEYSPEFNFPVEGVIGKYRVTATQAHNSFLHFIIELGLPGVIALLMIVAIIISNLLINMKNDILRKRKVLENYIVGPEMGMLAIVGMSMIHNALHNFCIFIIFIVFMSYSKSFATKKIAKKDKYWNPSFSKQDKIFILLVWGLSVVAIFYFLIFAPWLASKRIDRGFISASNGEFEKSLDDFSRTVKLIPFYSKAYMLKGNIYFIKFQQSGNLDHAFKSQFNYDQGLKYASRNYDLLKSKTHLLITIKNFLKKRNPKMSFADLDHEITFLFEKMSENRPKDPFILHDYAVYMRNEGRIDIARKLLENAIALEPNYVSANKLLGLIHQYNGDKEKSSFYLSRVREIQNVHRAEDYKNDKYLYLLLK